MNTIISRPEKTTTTRYLVGNQQEVFHTLKCAKGMKTGGYFDGKHIHITIRKETKEYGRIVIDYTLRENPEDFVQPVYTVYSAVGSWPRYSRLVAVTEAKEILKNRQSSWVTIVFPTGEEVHYSLIDGNIEFLGYNPEYRELSKAMDAIQWP